jgi:ABC-type transporter MlaC component
MAWMAIGSGWPAVSSAPQQQVIQAFERYVAAIYADRFDTHSGEQFQVLGVRVERTRLRESYSRNLETA